MARMVELIRIVPLPRPKGLATVVSNSFPGKDLRHVPSLRAFSIDATASSTMACTRSSFARVVTASAAPLLHVEYLGVGVGPTARLSVAPLASPPLAARADGSASTPGDSPIASFRFDFGDGTAPVTTTAPPPPPSIPTPPRAPTPSP